MGIGLALLHEVLSASDHHHGGQVELLAALSHDVGRIDAHLVGPQAQAVEAELHGDGDLPVAHDGDGGVVDAHTIGDAAPRLGRNDGRGQQQDEQDEVLGEEPLHFWN